MRHSIHVTAPLLASTALLLANVSGAAQDRHLADTPAIHDSHSSAHGTERGGFGHLFGEIVFGAAFVGLMLHSGG